MSNVFCFYFDGAIVQVLKADISGNAVTVADAHTFPHDELETFLSGCKEKSFILCCNPLLFHQDIVYLPPAAKRQYGRLVHSEIQKIHPELPSFSSFFTSVGQSTIDTKLYNKIAVFTYANDFLSDILSVFNRHGKSVSHIYAAPYSIFKLLSSTCQTDENQARIFIASIPGEKLLLVGEHAELEFIRKIPSTDVDLLPADAQNINMTLDYCFQTLRVKPVEAVMLDQVEGAGEQFPLLSVPLNVSKSHLLSHVPPYILADYLAPLAAALHSVTAPRIGDILPSDYVSYSRNKNVLSVGSALMIALALLVAGYTLTQWMVISDLKADSAVVRSHLDKAKEEIAAYKKLEDEVKALYKPLEMLNKQRTSLHPATALASLALPDSPEYSIKGVSIQDSEGFLAVQIEGTIDSNGFSNIQATFEWIIGQIGRIPGYTISSSTLDIKLKNFKILARYNGIASQKGK